MTKVASRGTAPHPLFVTKKVEVVVVNEAATGKRARSIREQKCVSLREVAKQIGNPSPMYLCDLENGKRSWNGRIARRYADWIVNGTNLASHRNDGEVGK